MTRSAARRRIVPVLAMVSLLLLSACSTQTGSVDGSKGFVAVDGSVELLAPSARAAAPQLSGTTLAGSKLDLATLRGKVVVLNYWASWCTPCRAEAASLQRAYDATHPEGVEFVGIVSGGKDSSDNASAFVRKFGLSYPSIYDGDNALVLALASSLPPTAIPSTLVLDREGRVAARTLGPVDYSGLRGMIDPLVAEKAAS